MLTLPAVSRIALLCAGAVVLSSCGLFNRDGGDDDFANLVDCRYVVDDVTGGIKSNNGIQVITSEAECLPGTVTADVQAALSGGPRPSAAAPQVDFTSFTPPPAIAQAPVSRPALQAPTPVATLSTDVAFEFNSAVLNPGFSGRLKQIAADLKSPGRQGQIFTVEGHTDSVGGEPYNQQLSEARARAVQRFLIAEGVESGRIIITGAGEMRPKAPNDNSAGRAINRRVEIYAR